MAFKTIMLAGGNDPCIREFAAAAAITPGHLLYMNSSGTVAVHATPGGRVHPMMIALENSLAGKTISDAYAAADRVQVWFPRNGDIALMRIVNGANIAIGDVVESQGDGTLREVVADTSVGTVKPDSFVGQAIVACDMSGSSGLDVAGGLCQICIGG